MWDLFTTILNSPIRGTAYRGRAWLRICQELASSHLSESLSVSLLCSVASLGTKGAKTKIGFKKRILRRRTETQRTNRSLEISGRKSSWKRVHVFGVWKNRAKNKTHCNCKRRLYEFDRVKQLFCHSDFPWNQFWQFLRGYFLVYLRITNKAKNNYNRNTKLQKLLNDFT